VFEAQLLKDRIIVGAFPFLPFILAPSDDIFLVCLFIFILVIEFLSELFQDFIDASSELAPTVVRGLRDLVHHNLPALVLVGSKLRKLEHLMSRLRQVNHPQALHVFADMALLEEDGPKDII